MLIKQNFVSTLLLLAIQSALCKVWQFGRDAPYSEIIYHGSGSISALEYTKHIQLTIPAGHKVTFLRVEVENFLSNADAFFDDETNIVTISYKPCQFSESRYDIIARGIKDPEYIPPEEDDIQPINNPALNRNYEFCEHL